MKTLEIRKSVSELNRKLIIPNNSTLIVDILLTQGHQKKKRTYIEDTI